MAYALVAHGGGGSTSSNGFTTSSINTTGANLIVVSVGISVNTGTLSDSNGNTWTPLTQQTDAFTSRWLQLFYCENPTVGAGHTFSITGTSNFPSLAVSAWSGGTTSSFDKQNGGNNGFSASVSTGSITPSVANELVIACCLYEANSTPTNGSSFTVTDTINPTNAFGSEPQQMAYLIQTTATAENVTFSWTGSSRNIGVIASFKAGGGGSVFNVSATEAASASEVESVSAVFAAADSETGIAVDTPSASAIFAASDSEAGTATDTSSGLWVTSSTITEAGTAVESESVTASFASSITEANSAADSYVNTAVFVASDTEAGSASDSPSSTAIFAASDTEAASAADSESSTGAVISDGVIEAASAAETETAIVTFAAAASEAGSATDASSNTAIFSAAASEAGSAIDAEDANGVFVASDTEAATATDLSNGIIPGPPSTDGPHSNPFFATPGPMTTVQ